MPLNKAQLKTTLRSICDDLYNNPDELTPEECREVFATRFSDAMDEFVKTGSVAVTVNTTGTATVHTGTGTGSMT